MNIVVKPSYDVLSAAVADEVVNYLRLATHPLFCPASGDTPAGLYNELVRRQQNGSIDTDQWFFVGLDEWAGMNGADQGSCRFYLDRQLFGPLHVPEDRIRFFDGRAKNPQEECGLVEQFIDRREGIDVVVLGLGMNGHVGMNEPGVDPDLLSHVAELDAVTKQVGQKYFTSEKELTQGLTLGITTILRARRIILMVNGEKKSSIVQRVVQGDVTQYVPASLLRNHPGFSIFLDETAASKL